MNKTQFWILTGLSGVLFVLIVTHILLVRQATIYANTITQAQQIINQGQAAKNILEKVAGEIGKESVEKQDQQLKDLLGRQQITFNANPPSADSATSNANPAPVSTPTH